jgi:hypothetical protein
MIKIQTKPHFNENSKYSAGSSYYHYYAIGLVVSSFTRYLGARVSELVSGLRSKIIHIHILLNFQKKTLIRQMI